MPSNPTTLDLGAVRSQFPGLASSWTFLDNAGGSQVLLPVAERLGDYLLHTNVQLGASYEPSQRAGARVEDGVQAAADWIGARDSSQVVLGASSSMLLRNLATSLGRTWRAGDEVVVTDCDHEANIGPWVDLEREGVIVRTWRIDPESWSLRIEDLEPLLNERTRLVAFTHASNLVGTIHPVAEITERVHAAGALVCVDGVAYAPHRQIDVEGWGVDFYVFSFYKVYGPHCALLYGRRELLERLPRINHFFLEEEIPYKLQPGNVNYEMTYSLCGLWDYIATLDSGGTAGVGASSNASRAPRERRGALAGFFDQVAAQEEEIVKPLLAFLSQRPDVRLVGVSDTDRGRRVPTVSFHVPGRPSEEIVRLVDRHRIGIRFGDFYARRLVDRLGIGDGVVRVSAVHYNTVSEVERAVDAIGQALG